MDVEEYISLECRWFFRHPIPDTFHKMFIGLAVDSRTDIYWIKNIMEEPLKTDEGVKLREGRYEVKSLLDQRQDYRIPANIQKWKKVSKEIKGRIDIDKTWLKIPKRRQLFMYKANDGYLEGPISYLPSDGCNIELTQFDKPFNDHWTFGFEAHGDENELDEILLKGFEIITTVNQDLSDFLERENSKSYPEWISELI